MSIDTDNFPDFTPRPDETAEVHDGSTVRHSGDLPVEEGGERPVEVHDTSLAEDVAAGRIVPPIDTAPAAPTVAPQPEGGRRLSRKAKAIIGGTVAVVLLGGGIGAGLAMAGGKKEEGATAPSTPAATSSPFAPKTQNSQPQTTINPETNSATVVTSPQQSANETTPSSSEQPTISTPSANESTPGAGQGQPTLEQIKMMSVEQFTALSQNAQLEYLYKTYPELLTANVATLVNNDNNKFVPIYTLQQTLGLCFSQSNSLDAKKCLSAAYYYTDPSTPQGQLYAHALQTIDTRGPITDGDGYIPRELFGPGECVDAAGNKVTYFDLIYTYTDAQGKADSPGGYGDRLGRFFLVNAPSQDGSIKKRMLLALDAPLSTLGISGTDFSSDPAPANWNDFH